MSGTALRHVYGPVPSRRLGRSLGIDLVPLKTCTYDCVYCQLGRTTNKTLVRKDYVAIDEVMAELERKLAEEDRPDYISLAGSGEPTLNSGIGELIVRIKSLTDIPVAVLTNSSLLWMSEVQEALLPADLVLPSLDAGDEDLFRYVNRPHRDICFDRMVDGLTEFMSRFAGEVWLEVFLLAGATGMAPEAAKIATAARRIGATRVQLNTVTRPPTEQFAYPLTSDQMLALRGLFSGRVEVISEYEHADVFSTGLAEASAVNIISLLSRRPCTSADVASGLGIHVTEALKHLEALVRSGKVTVNLVDGKAFYVGASRPKAGRA